jgi:predicted dehydrogenase
MMPPRPIRYTSYMDSRRIFLGKVASGLGTLAVAPGRVLGANDRIRVGFIGFGDRGLELFNYVRSCAHTEAAAFCDVYTQRLERAQAAAPGVTMYRDYRRMLEDASIDAVMIATPPHLHAEHFCAALDAGKHVYQEKTMALTLDHAKRMRAAWKRHTGKHVVAIGHQVCSSGQARDARMFLAEPARMGKITAIGMRMYRNTSRGRAPGARRPTQDMNPENIAWDLFLGEAPAREFDANRFVNWRHFWDYSSGNISENMTQQLAFWYKALRLKIPQSATASGGVFVWKDGRETPDTMSVALAQPEEMLIHWSCGSGNDHPGAGEQVLGENGTISREAQLRYFPQKANRPEGNEMTGRASHVPHAHVEDFFDAIRTGREPSCPFELGWRVSIAASMAVESYRRSRTVRWDAKKEEIV